MTLDRGQVVGLYGGSFNPAHKGHVHVAETARKRLGLDRVVWLVSPQNPLKSADATVELGVRMAGVRRLAQGLGARGNGARGRGMIVSDIERRIGTRYTIDTVRWLKARFPTVRFVWIMGADSLASFHRWRGWADLAREVPIAVVSRPGFSPRGRLSPLARRFASHRRPAREGILLARRAVPAWIYLEAPFHAVSSTALRNSRLTKSRSRDNESDCATPSRSIR
jgi:nicotinate-nucleotide adenylyltransferase